MPKRSARVVYVSAPEAKASRAKIEVAPKQQLRMKDHTRPSQRRGAVNEANGTVGSRN